MPEYVKMRIKRSTREAVKALGRKGETYDIIVRRLIHIDRVLVIAQTETPEAASIIHELGKQHPLCPKCGAEVIRDDRAVYTETGEVDQLVFWKCQECGLEW